MKRYGVRMNMENNGVYSLKYVYPIERNNNFSFCWSKREFEILFANTVEYGFILEGYLPGNDNSLHICSDCGEVILHTIPDWQLYPVLLKSNDGCYKINVENDFVPGDGDDRHLGICIRHIEVVIYENYKAIEFAAKKLENTYEILSEYKKGKTILSHYPTQLAITTSNVCNIGEHEPCVYCLYKYMKEEEEKSIHKVLDVKSIHDYGEFFYYANIIVDCSLGEPFMNKDFISILDNITTDKKFSFTTNGQFLTDKNISHLLGKNIDMYVSIDAADAKMYANYRNNRFDEIVKSLKKRT